MKSGSQNGLPKTKGKKGSRSPAGFTEGKVLDFVKAAKVAVSPAEIIAGLGISGPSVNQALIKLKKEGKVSQAKARAPYTYVKQ